MKDGHLAGAEFEQEALRALVGAARIRDDERAARVVVGADGGRVVLGELVVRHVQVTRNKSCDHLLMILPPACASIFYCALSARCAKCVA